MIRRLLAFLFAFALSCAAIAQEAPASAPQSAEQFLASLKYQDGQVTLPGGIATLNLPAGFRYLNPADTERVLHDAWGNPPGNQTLGMIVPANATVLSDEGWGVIITYDKDGHVKDDDAATIDYAGLLKDMQASVNEDNEQRRKEGYRAMTLVGWAEPPAYDKAAHKLYWAKEFSSEGASVHTLNYNIRVLGREGVLVLNAVAGMNQIDSIKREMKQVTAFTDFTPGNRYADFNASTDKVAEYGLAALIAGGVAAKLGFFGKLLAILIAAKKLVILAVAAIGGWLFKLFGRRKEGRAAAQEAAQAHAQAAQAPAVPVSLDKRGDEASTVPLDQSGDPEGKPPTISLDKD